MYRPNVIPHHCLAKPLWATGYKELIRQRDEFILREFHSTMAAYHRSRVVNRTEDEDSCLRYLAHFFLLLSLNYRHNNSRNDWKVALNIRKIFKKKEIVRSCRWTRWIKNRRGFPGANLSIFDKYKKIIVKRRKMQLKFKMAEHIILARAETYTRGKQRIFHLADFIIEK